MYKKLYIRPIVKTHVPKFERPILAGTFEDINDPADWNSKQGFMDDDEESSAWGNVWK
jgi:hypothetical protein